MAERMKGLLPLAAAVGILAFVWTCVALNFSFHWITDGDLGNGLDLPSNFQLMVPAAVVSWAMYFAAGGDGGGAREVEVGDRVRVVGDVLRGGWRRSGRAQGGGRQRVRRRGRTRGHVALAGDRGPAGLLG